MKPIPSFSEAKFSRQGNPKVKILGLEECAFSWQPSKYLTVFVQLVS